MIEREAARRGRTRLVIAVTLTVGLACVPTSGGGDRPLFTVPESGAGAFHYLCVDFGDAECDGDAFTTNAGWVDAQAGPLPTRFAVGSRFDVRYTPSRGRYDRGDVSEEVVSIRPEPAASELVTQDSLGFVALQPGRVGLFARDLDGTVHAWVHLTVSRPARLDVVASRHATLTVGSEVYLAARLLDANGVALAGAVEYFWATDAPEVMEVTGGTPDLALSETDDDAVARMLAPGTATLRVEAAGLVDEVVFEVQSP